MIKGILFNTDMVRATLDGRKTVTRRAIKPANTVRAKAEGYHQGYGLWIEDDTDNPDKCGHIKDYSVSPLWSSFAWYTKKYAPYQPGDILYVRETWKFFGCIGCEGDERGCCAFPERWMEDKDGCFVYRATDDVWESDGMKWYPSIHMPKEAARIWLKVTDVRVERLQDICDEQIRKEGFIPEVQGHYKFKWVWDSTIPKKDLNKYGWNANPWVWVIEFERTVKPDE